MDFSLYRNQLLQRPEGEIALAQLVRNFTQWFFDLLRNFVLVGGLKYFYEKSGSTVLFYLHEFALIVIFLYCLSYADQWYINLFIFLQNKRLAHWAQPDHQHRPVGCAVLDDQMGRVHHRGRDLPCAGLSETRIGWPPRRRTSAVCPGKFALKKRGAGHPSCFHAGQTGPI